MVTVTLKSSNPYVSLAVMSSPTSNKYLFISGKNWKLSLAELASYLQARAVSFEFTEFSRSFFAVQTETPLEASVIDELGGALKMAEVKANLPSARVAEAFLQGSKQAKKELKFAFPLDVIAQRMPSAASGKAVYGVSVYWEQPEFRPAGNTIHRYVANELKDELKAQNKKVRFMGFPRDRDHPQLTPVEVLKQGLVENHAEVLLCIGKKETSIGTTIGVHNPFEFQKRDVDKPVQRKIFAIPPRIAKIMVNLTQCTPSKVFLDPFCGVGTILLEALLAKAKVIGLDVNRWCVDAAKQNIEWLVDEYSLQEADYVVVQGDSRKLTSKIRDDIDCLATEPDLGPAMREVPTVPYAEKIVENLRPLYTDFLMEAQKILRQDGYIALVSPSIKTRSAKPVNLNLREIAERLGFKTVNPLAKAMFSKDNPLPESIREAHSFFDVDERHLVGREITILQKA
jgi:tRNA G10  N-methylase Trm11